LLSHIQHSIESSRIGAIGIGTQADQAKGLHDIYPDKWQAIQYNWSAFSGALLFPDTFQIIFWITGRNFKDTHQRLIRNSQLLRQWSEKVDLDLFRPDELRALLLKSALLANDRGITLVYSSNIDHIHRNVAIAENTTLDRSAKVFLDLLWNSHYPEAIAAKLGLLAVTPNRQLAQTLR
jgi:hypothetical protein